MRGRREEDIRTDRQLTNQLGVTIRAWRRHWGLSVTDLAVQAGFGKKGRGYISKIEHNLIKHVGDNRLDSIATALHLTSTDLLQHRMPETQAVKQERSLDKAIVGCKALLKVFPYRSLNWARIHFKLAELYWKHATFSSDATARGEILTEAHQCIEHALLTFREKMHQRRTMKLCSYVQRSKRFRGSKPSKTGMLDSGG
jgi:transcriptional regulator with XRE-family HTH domain